MNFITRYKDNITTKLVVNIILIHAVLMVIIVVDMLQREHSFIHEQLAQEGKELTSVIASGVSVGLLNNDLVALNELIKDMESMRNVSMIFVLDQTGRVRASRPDSYFNMRLSDPLSKELLQRIRQGEKNLVQSRHHGVFDTLAKVRVGERTVGYVRVIMDTNRVEARLEEVTKKGVFYIIFAIILGGVIAYASIRQLTRRLGRITEAAREISQKNFHVTLPTKQGQNDEIAIVTDAFNVMIDSLGTHMRDLEDRAMYDALTRLYNRKAYEEHLGQMVSAFHRYGHGFSYLMFDIDDFKHINDTYGHGTGDRVLVTIAKLCKEMVRMSDRVYRIGGEEFVILFEETKLADAYQAAEKVRTAVEEAVIVEGERITISGGLAEVNKDDTPYSLYARADNLLYQSKHTGKNKISTAIKCDVSVRWYEHRAKKTLFIRISGTHLCKHSFERSYLDEEFLHLYANQKFVIIDNRAVELETEGAKEVIAEVHAKYDAYMRNHKITLEKVFVLINSPKAIDAIYPFKKTLNMLGVPVAFVDSDYDLIDDEVEFDATAFLQMDASRMSPES